MYSLGLSAFYHDSAAALVRDGEIIAAAQEERFSRRKHDSDFPLNALAYCLETADLSLSEVDLVTFYDKPFLKFERLLETYVTFAPRGFQSFRKAVPVWLKEKLFQKDLLIEALKSVDPAFDPADRLLFGEHHFSHAASAYYPSPFDEAVVLTMDGVGEWATTSVAIGRGRELEVIREIHFPHSLGLLYSAMTYYTGFRVNSGEYKVMGLAPYGEPKYRDLLLDHVIDLKPDGSFRLDQSYFDYCTGLRMTNDKWDALFGGPARQPEELLTQRHMDLAASVQAVIEEAVLRLTRSLAAETGIRNLCLAGGVALNCVANGRDTMKGSYLGPVFAQSDIESRLTAAGARFTVVSDDELITRTADALATEAAVGWFQGRMEYGPRALGGRSILADPRSPAMQKTLNLKVKYRESFRPFAPSVLREDVADWFELDEDSPYMLMVADVVEKRRLTMSKEEQALFGIEKLNVPRSDIPAVTHVDYSARIQTVHHETNPRYHDLITAFRDRTGCPILVNTSFNVRGEPIVCTPEDAFRCMMGSEIDLLAVGNCLLRKEDQNPDLALDYKNAFDLD